MGFFKNFVIFTEKPGLDSVFNEVAGLQTCKFIKKNSRHRCFLVNIAKFFRTLLGSLNAVAYPSKEAYMLFLQVGIFLNSDSVSLNFLIH